MFSKACGRAESRYAFLHILAVPEGESGGVAMRVLCSAVALEGHVRPLLPIATTLVKAGHEVRFATGPDLHARVREAGLTPVTAGPSGSIAFAASARMPRLAKLPANDRGAATFSQVIAPAKLPDLERILATWPPDLVIHEATDLAAPIAAATAGVPTVTQGWGLVPLLGLTTPAPTDVAVLWRSRGLEPEPYAGMFGRLHLHPAPPGLQPDAQVPVGRLQPMRLEATSLQGEALPGWADDLGQSGRPVIHVSLGTHTYFSQPEFLRIILEGLAGLEVEIVATISRHNDPASLGHWPRSVHVERWLPLPWLLPRCSMVVCHAGAGTLLASLAAGLPLVLLPRGADQFENAAASERAGAARVVPPEMLTSRAIRDQVEQVLQDASYRAAAGRLRTEIEAMPSPSVVVRLLEDVVHGPLGGS
jgi:UDP:flavonoid glycosyltransferase YjiC (YdhE family)